MMNEEKYLLQLIKSYLTGLKPPMPNGINLKKLYDIAYSNQFEHIIYTKFKELGIHDETNEIMHLFHQRYGYAIRRDALQDAEIEEISKLFSENNVLHIFLKGSIVKKYYPSPFLRKSGDIDLLINNNNKEKADDLLKKSGFICTINGNGVEDVYERGKSIVEVHTKLTYDDDISAKFCDKVWEHSALKKGTLYETEAEYMYVYLLTHLRKHLLTAGGGGIKLILDLYLMNKNIDLDKDKINEYAECAKINNLRQYAEKLSLKWFSDMECDKKNVLILESLLLNSGAHGDYSNYININLSKNGNKTANLFRLLFPSFKDMKIKYPEIENKPFLLPLSWVWRVRDAKKTHTKTILKSAFAGLSKEDSATLAKFCDTISK